MYKSARLVDPELNTSEFVPAMFDTTRKLRLRDGVTLSPEQFVAGPATLEERRTMGYPDMAEPAVRHGISTSFGSGGFFGVKTDVPLQMEMPGGAEIPARGVSHPLLS